MIYNEGWCIECDGGCGSEHIPKSNVQAEKKSDAIKMAKRYGWKITPQRQLCPVCWEKTGHA